MSTLGDRNPTSTSELVFEAPAPGRWELETAHHGLRPLSPFIRQAYQRAFEGGIVEPLQRYGLPLATVEAKFVHGCLYMRPLAIGERPGSTPKAPPPVFVMKLLTRLHPELRRRAKTAERAFAERSWRQEVDRWFDHDRAAQVAKNLAIQDVDVESLDDEALRSHVERALSHFENSARRNMATRPPMHRSCRAARRTAGMAAMNEARLILTCGLPGAGKTTLAKELAAERGAVRLTKDEWQRALGSSPWDRDVGEKIEQELWRLAQEILRLGLSVVLDFGLWARVERDQFRTAARDLGVGVELHFLDAPLDELWRRIEARNSAPPWDGEPITRAHLEDWYADFQAPDAAELASFDSAPR